MEIGISTACLFNRFDTEDCFSVIKSLGANLAEVFLNTFSEYEPSYCRLLKKRMEAAGVGVYSVHPMSAQFESQLFSIHRRQRSDALDIYKKVLESGGILGAKCYVMHGAAHLSGAAKNLQDELILERFRELTEVARASGLTLALENVSWCIYHDSEYGRMLKDGLGDGKLKFVLDIKQAVRSGTSPFDYIDAIGEDLINVHLCDYKFIGGISRPFMPCKGEFDFGRLKSALEGVGYKSPLFIEVYSDTYGKLEELGEAYRCLQELFYSH
ncbi:MAG: sugar phosphate isomerase/epimerase [Clostridia bacterium]|nr:sugar phosphate isomerase/epimerase [Clostridia bacterium]